MSSSKGNFDEINLNDTTTIQPKSINKLTNPSSNDNNPVNEQQKQIDEGDKQNSSSSPNKSPKSSVSSGSLASITPSSTPPMPAALNSPESPAFYSLVSGIEIDEESSGDDDFVEARNELIIKEKNVEEIVENQQQQQPPKPPRKSDIVNTTKPFQEEEKEIKIVQQTNNKPNELPMLGIIPNESKVSSNSSEQTKQNSPPPGYTSVYPPINNGGQLPTSCFMETTQGGIGYIPKATYYIDGNVGGPAIIISQGESKVSTPVFLFSPNPYDGEEYLRRRRALSFLSCTLILLPLFTLLLIILSWGSYYY